MTAGVRSRKKKDKISKTVENALDSASSQHHQRVRDLSSSSRRDEAVKRLEDVSGAHLRERRSGDGESIPDTPPNEASVHSDDDDEIARQKQHQQENSKTAVSEERRPRQSPLSVSISFDAVAVVLLLAAAATRVAFLDQPRNVVFDEMHYGKYAVLYLRRVFFFDSNPPLGKMLVAAAASLSGYDGAAADPTSKSEEALTYFDRIGTPYPDSLPIFAMRLVPALSGSAVAPVLYLLLCEMGLSPWAGFAAGMLVVFDTALLAQSRFILLEPMVLLFSLLALLCVLKFRRHQRKPFSQQWWLWITAAATFMGLAFCVKYLAVYSCWLCCLVLAQDFWRRRLPDRQVSLCSLFMESFTQIAVVSLIPAAIYVGVFKLHLAVLTKAGHHDSLMTSAFQASLEGGLGSIVRGQPAEVAHGSQITLRHTHGKTCWLHSHEHVYPVRYDDGRGSSHQQQVSCYGYKDVNNWWIVKRPDREDLAVQEPVDVIKDGDVVQIVHGMTHRALNSHDVAAPLSPHNQEISCYIDYNISMPAENLWRVDVVNSHHTGHKKWNAIASQVRLIHTTTGQALKFSPRVLPEWGFHQNEVVADKVIDQMDTVWNVEEHRYTKNDEDKKTLERELFNHELIPQQPTQMSFAEKFAELQLKMLITNQENVQNHNYASDPTEWPFLTRGIAYYISKTSNAQVHLLGNILIWYSGSLCMLSYCGLLVFYSLRRRRQCFDLAEEAFQHFLSVGRVLLGGYLLHFLPFFFYDRTLFVTHYLPAYLFKIMMAAFMAEHVYEVAGAIMPSSTSALWTRRAVVAASAAWLTAAAAVFVKFAPLAYGFVPLSKQDVRALQWKDTWDLIVHKP